jgi:hypothetical protein
MSDGVQTQDDALEELVSFLDDRVGQGRWVMVLTADHGAQRDPNVVGAFPIDIGRLKQGLMKTFDDDGDGVPLLLRMRPTQAWLDKDELADNGFTLQEISGWFVGLTKQEVFKSKFLHSEVTLEPGHENDPVFAAALPSRSFARLPCLSGAGS